MTTKQERQNVIGQIAQGNSALLDIIAEYKNGVDVSEALANWYGGGTSGTAIKEYLESNVKKKSEPKKKRSTKTKKDTPPSLEN